MLAGINQKISRLRDAVSSTEQGARTPNASKDDLMQGWHTGTLQQRRALLKRYLHGIEVLPPVEANTFNRAQLVKKRLHPQWKTKAEVGV
jgi:hypothetical protein